MSFNFLNESPEFPYTVSVQPPPADTSEVKIRKQAPDGEELAVENLQTEGSGVFTLQLSGRTLEESPLWLEFVFEKLDPDTNDVVGHDEIRLAVPLGEPVPGTLEAPADAIPGDTVEVRVSAWGAHAWDGDADDPRYFAPGAGGPADDRVASDARSGVKWKLTVIEGEGESATRATEDLSDTGETLNFSVTDDHVGKTLEFEAYVGDEAPGHAKAQVAVPKLELKVQVEGEDEPVDAPAEFQLGETLTFLAVVTPPVEGEITWETDPADTEAFSVARAEEPGSAELVGRQATKDDANPKLKPKLVSAATTKETQIEHELAVTPRVLDVRFQRSPGVGDDRGINGLEFKVSHPDGSELQTGTTGEDGKIELQFAGDGTKLELMVSGSPVAEYTLHIRAGALEGISGVTGQQRRLRMLGYHLGHAGDDQVGVDGEMGPITDRAIANFQADHDQNFSGHMGSSTRTLLDADLASLGAADDDADDDAEG